MATIDFNKQVQPPSIVHSPTPLSLQGAQYGGLFSNGHLAWSVSNGNLSITNTASGECVQCWSPATAGYEVTLVSEIKSPKCSLLVVALEGCGQHIVGVVSAGWGKLVRAITVPNPVTALHPFNCKGFLQNAGNGFSYSDIFPHSVLSSFNGIVAVGTEGGHVYLIDLQLRVKTADSNVDCLNTPSPMHIIEGQVTERDLAVMSDSGHVTVEISRENIQRGKFKYQNTLLPVSAVKTTALYFAPQIMGLFIGYSFGEFQLYDLSTFQLQHSSALVKTPSLPPVTHFTYVEPENDPRNFVYVWVVRGKSRFVEGSSYGIAYLYQMIFTEKTTPTAGSTLYRGFRGCGLRFEYVLNGPGEAHKHVPGTSVQLVHCGTPVRYRREQPVHVLELDLSVAVLVWVVSRHNTVDVDPVKSGRVERRMFVALFDVNQWYHSQMPRVIRWKTKGVFGCSYFAFYDLTSCLLPDGNAVVIDMLVEGLLPFQSHPPMPETFMWPSALKFDVKLLTETAMTRAQCLGAQRMVLHELEECRCSLYAQPERLFRLCARSELLPPTCDHTPSSLSSQRAALLGVAVGHGAPTRILTAFADSWAGSGGGDPVISQWVASTRNEMEQAKETIFSKYFGEEVSHLPSSTYWKKMSAIEVFLEHLLNRGFERVGKSGPVFEAVSQLHLTITKHKKVMEVVRFLSEQGLGSDYPAAALRRRYDMLRGGTESVTKLAIDCLIEDHHGNSDNSAPLYPPPSLPDFMDFLLKFDPLILHCLVVYLLCDLGSLHSPRLSPHTLYASGQELPNSLVNTMHSLWLVDNTKFKDPAYEEDSIVLFMKSTSPPLFPWQHGVILERLMRWGEVGVALSYLQTHGQEMHGLEEIKLKLGVFVGNGLVSTAYGILKQYEGSESYEELFTFFLECCIEGKSLHSLLDLPLSSVAEATFVLHLEQHHLLACREFLVFYFLLRHRFVEAMATQEKLRPFAKTDPDPNALERCNQRDALLAGLGSVVPSSLHSVRLTGGRQRGQGSKVTLQVEKSLSAVVAKAVKNGYMSGGSGEVFSLIQSIADKRLAPSDPFTPMRPSRGSVAELSHTPFLSTPISVKRVRAPLTAGRTRPLITPTPRSRPLTPRGSQTQQRYASPVQSFKDRLATLLSQSESTTFDLSTVQTPSPMSAVQLIRPIVATPTSILKGTRSGSKLSDRRIRFAVDGSPSPVKESRPLFTPSISSSLSTTKTVAMTISPPSSDEDEDMYESPVESPSQLDTPDPSQLHTPTPSQTPTHTTPLPAQLEFNDAEDTSTTGVGVATTIAMETDHKPSDDIDTADSDDAVEQDGSFVEQDMSDDESDHASSEDLSSTKLHIPKSSPVEPSPQSSPVRPEMPKPSTKSSPVKPQTSKLSPLQGLKLARESLTSSVSLKIAPITMSSKPTPATTSSLISSPFTLVTTTKETHHTPRAVSGIFTPVSMATTPASQLFSPVPYLSDLVAAKKEKLKCSIELLKKQELSKIKATPSPKPPPTVKVSQSFSSTMVPNVGVSTNSPYSFTPPTQVPIKTHPTLPAGEPEPMSFAFSPPLTRSAARRQREESMSRESSVEPVAPPGPVSSSTSEGPTTKKRTRGRPRKMLPPTDETIHLVTPPTLPRPLREQTGKQRTRVKPVRSGVGSRRSTRLLSGKK